MALTKKPIAHVLHLLVIVDLDIVCGIKIVCDPRNGVQAGMGGSTLIQDPVVNDRKGREGQIFGEGREREAEEFTVAVGFAVHHDVYVRVLRVIQDLVRMDEEGCCRNRQRQKAFEVL